jgi:hypothetical protein
MSVVRFEPGRQISTLLRVDSHNLGDILLSFTFPILGVIVPFVFVWADHPEKKLEDKLYAISAIRAAAFSSSVGGLFCLHLYFDVHLACKRSLIISASLLRVNFSSHIYSPSENSRSPVLIYQSEFAFTIHFHNDSEDSSPLLIFLDRLAFRSAYHLSLSITSENLDLLNGLEIIWKSGDRITAWVSIAVRAFFCLVAFSISLLYTNLLKSCPFSGWAIEQKFTIFLSVARLLSDFPLAGPSTS